MTFLNDLSKLLRKHKSQKVNITMVHLTNQPCAMCRCKVGEGDISGFYVRKSESHYTEGKTIHYITPPLPSRQSPEVVEIGPAKFGNVGGI